MIKWEDGRKEVSERRREEERCGTVVGSRLEEAGG
jgi:hypothetical protein